MVADAKKSKIRQQKETLEYFKAYAGDWGEKAKTGKEGKVNVIRQRNDYVLKVLSRREKTENVLDVGCGTGDLICEIAKRGIKAVGVDFSEEMIEIARKNAAKVKCGRASFECSSIFDFKTGKEEYDLISANGFIEYISYKELDALLDKAFQALKPEGSLILGSRNRLFNIFSLNDFTKEEIDEGNAGLLLLEAIKIAESENIESILDIETAPLQKEDKKHKATAGIKVSTRYQFTPVQLAKKVKEKGFFPVEIFPIHIHCATSKFQKKEPEVNDLVSNLLQKYAEGNWDLIPYASSFMLNAKKD